MRRMCVLAVVLAALLARPVCAEHGAEAVGSRLTFQCNFQGWVWIGFWDAADGSWVAGLDLYGPSNFTIHARDSGVWYWIGVWDYAAGTWAFGNWHFKMLI